MIVSISLIRFLINIKMKIFDSATHPTINKTWLNPRFNNYCDIELLQQDLERFNIYKAFAIGLDGVGGYKKESFVHFISGFKNLIPIAYSYLNFGDSDFRELKALGYKGIKIHPRLLQIEPDDNRIFKLIDLANEYELTVLYCGYLGVSQKFVDCVGESKLIFLHTGGKDCQKTFKLIKHKTNILCDFSYTMQFGALDETICNIFKNYPERVCVGSDHPEVNLGVFRERFDLLTDGLDVEKKEMIAYRNIECFCHIS